MTRFEDLIGKTIIEIVGGGVGDDEILFHTSCGKKYKMYHNQGCCESVYLADVCGDISDLIGSEILNAEEVNNCEQPDNFNPKYEPESFTWTFYHISTMKGTVTLRWYGTSNGYYSESVDFEEIETE